jgi:hypothetical protein
LSEPPLQVNAEGTEPIPRKVGHKVIDMAVAGAAILISLISLFVAVSHGRTMEKLVAANSWPLLRYDTGNLDDQTQLPVITLTIENVGVGPALVKSFAVFLDGKRVADQGELLRTCCGPAPRLPQPSQRGDKEAEIGVVTSSVANTVIRAGEGRDYVRLANTPSFGAQWEALNQARFRLTFEACYCSVLGDCWKSALTGVDAEPVKECPAAPPEDAPAPRKGER